MPIPEHPIAREQRVVLVGLALVALVIGVSLVRSYSRLSSSDRSGQDTAADKISASANTISADDLKNRLLKPDLGKKTLILDLRDSGDFSIEHIIGSRNVTMDTLMNAVPADRPDGFLVVVVDRADMEPNSNQATNSLMQGKVPAATLKGGYESWVAGLGQTISWGNPQSTIDVSKIHIISVEQAKDAFDKNRPFVTFIDTRTTDSFKAGHIPGAINIPLDDLEARRGDIPIRPNTVVYNDNVLGSFQSAVRLFDLNFFDARVIEDGWNAWKNKGYPVEK